MKDVKKFCLPSKFKTIISMTVIFIAIYVVVLISLFLDDDLDDISENFPVYAIITLVIMLIIFGIIYYDIVIKPHKKFKMRLKFFRKNNMDQYIIGDFTNGIRMFNDNIIVGEHCIMGRGQGLIVFYSEIESFYCYVKKNVDEDGHSSLTKSLRIVGGGKEYLLCHVDNWTVSEPEYIRLCTFLKIKNPNIIIK